MNHDILLIDAMKIEPLNFEALSPIEHKTCLATSDTGVRILILAFSGTCRARPKGDADVSYMIGVAKQVLAAWGADALVFDLAALQFEEADSIVAVITTDVHPNNRPLPRTVVVSDQARAELKVPPPALVCEDLEAAVHQASNLALEQAKLESECKDRLKMYILIRDSAPIGFALTAAAHASLATYARFVNTWETRLWMAGIFRKVICRVNDKDFERAKRHPDHVVITESALGGQEVALGFKPRVAWPKDFQYFQLYR